MYTYTDHSCQRTPKMTSRVEFDIGEASEDVPIGWKILQVVKGSELGRRRLQQKKRKFQKMLFTYLNKRDNLKGKDNQWVVTLVVGSLISVVRDQSALHHIVECQKDVLETLSTIATELNKICDNHIVGCFPSHFLSLMTILLKNEKIIISIFGSSSWMIMSLMPASSRFFYGVHHQTGKDCLW